MDARRIFSTGRWTGTYAVLSADRRMVENLLPDSIELGDQAITPSGRHPVYFLFGRQGDVAGGLPPFDRFGVTYNEAVVLVPYLRVRGTEGSFSYMPRLYLNSWWPTFLGVRVFGFDKQRQQVSSEPRDFVVRTDQGELLFSARFEAAWGDDRETVVTGYERMADALSLPIVGFRGRTAVVSQMIFTNIFCAPVTLQLHVGDPLLRTAGFESVYSFDGLNDMVANTSAFVVSDWVLGYPARAGAVVRAKELVARA